MKQLLFLVVCFLSVGVLNAQQINISVFDKNSGESVGYAYVEVYSGTDNSIQLKEQTNIDGQLTITPQYPCIVKVYSLGYEQAKRTFYTAPEKSKLVLHLAKEFSALNEVVVTGLNRPERQKDALSVYKVITSEQIQAQGAITLNEVMKNQLNVRVDNDNILGSSMRMQGLSGNKVKILIDGLPINGREGGNINLSQINMTNVDRIELIQGPMSVVYGTDALGGVVNIITKNQNKNLGVNVGGYYESLGRYKADVNFTKKIADRHQVTIGGGRNYFEGWQKLQKVITYKTDTLYTSRGYLFKPQDQYLGNFAYNYTAPSSFNLRFASDFLKEEIENKGSIETWDPFIGAYAQDEYYNTTRSMNRLSMSGKLGRKGTWQSQNGYMLYYRTRTSYVKDLVTMQSELSQATGDQDTSKFEDVYARGSYNNTVGKLSYTVGYDINLQFARSLKINTTTKKIQDYAAYTNLSMPFFDDKLTVQAGLRASYNSIYSPPVIPSVNLLYKPIDKVQLRASYARGYRAPSLKEMYLSFIDLNHYVIGNENLKAENSSHIQVSASYQAYEDGDNYLQFVLSGFYNDVYDGITLAPIHPEDPTSIEYTYANFSHQQNTITSLQADGQVKDFHYVLGYSYNYTFADGDNYQAFSASEATATLQYAWRKPGLNFNAFYKLYGTQPFLQANIDGSASYNGTQNAFHICDVSIEKKFFDRRLQVTAGIKNLFDIQQPTVSGRASSGAHGGGIASFLPRSVFTSLRLSLN